MPAKSSAVAPSDNNGDQVDVLEAEFFQRIRRTLTADEIPLMYPEPPAAIKKSAMLAVPEFLTSHSLRYGPDILPVLSDVFIDDLVRKKSINPAAAEHAVHALVKLGYIHAVPVHRPDKEVIRMVQVFRPLRPEVFLAVVSVQPGVPGHGRRARAGETVDGPLPVQFRTAGL
jgi:hypothetical protein